MRSNFMRLKFNFSGDQIFDHEVEIVFVHEVEFVQ